MNFGFWRQRIQWFFLRLSEKNETTTYRELNRTMGITIMLMYYDHERSKCIESRCTEQWQTNWKKCWISMVKPHFNDCCQTWTHQMWSRIVLCMTSKYFPRFAWFPFLRFCSDSAWPVCVCVCICKREPNKRPTEKTTISFRNGFVKIIESKIRAKQNATIRIAVCG